MGPSWCSSPIRKATCSSLCIAPSHCDLGCSETSGYGSSSRHFHTRPATAPASSLVAASSRQLTLLRCFLLLFCVHSSLSGSLRVEPRDHWQLELSLKLKNLQENVSLARTTIKQPQGYSVTLESPVRVEAGFARWQIVYPLIDEGRFEVKPGTWDGYWEMGQYDFEAELLAGGIPVQRSQAALDPMSLCPRDRYGPIVVKYPRQFIECFPERPA